jgi:hypothetical protein
MYILSQSADLTSPIGPTKPRQLQHFPYLHVAQLMLKTQAWFFPDFGESYITDHKQGKGWTLRLIAQAATNTLAKNIVIFKNVGNIVASWLIHYYNFHYNTFSRSLNG